MSKRLLTRSGLYALGLSLVLLVAPAHADVIYLTSGGIVKGTIVSERPGEVVIKTSGGETVIARDEIERIERGASPDAMYRERLKKIPFGDAEGHYQLGLWLKRINAKELAREEFQKTIMLDPEHKFARTELGYIRVNGETWALPNEKVEDQEPIARPAAPSEPRASELRERAPASEPKPEARKVEPPVPQFRSDGLSSELVKAIGNLDKAEGEARAKAWEELSKTEDGESDRLATALLGPFSKARDQAWRQLMKAVPTAEPLVSKVPSEGAPKDDPIRDELKAHVESYRELVVKPAIEAAVAQHERKSAASLEKIVKTVRALAAKDWKQPSAVKNREKALEWWSKARDEALKTIFDLKIYPDENHGRVGQPIVDEKVDKVRETWQFFDPMITRDVARFVALPEAEAKSLMAKLDELRARRVEARSFLDRRGSSIPIAATDELEPAFEAMVRYRAAEFDAVAKIELKGAWEQQLLHRLRDLRVMDYNESFRSGGRKVEKGKQPSGDEVEQVKLTNEYRMMMNRNAVELEARLVESARGHSEEMTRLGYFAHESPVGANKSPFDRMKNAGYTFPGGENISLGSEAPKATHLAWYNSSGHHRNILNEGWAAMGSGKDGRHWTQNFGPAGTLRR